MLPKPTDLLGAAKRHYFAETALRFERWWVAAVVMGYLFLATGFSLGPIFEGPDEKSHYLFVQTLVRTAALPDPAKDPFHEYHQPPLYYALVSPVLMLVDDSDFDERIVYNPFFGYQIQLVGNDNKNYLLHSRVEAFPYNNSPTALAVHLIRLLSVLMGAGTVIASYHIFKILWPERPDRRLMALAFVAFWPQFLFLSSLINNDNLLYLLATLSLLVLLRQLRDGPSWRGSILLGVLLGAALVTKTSAALLALPVGFASLADRRMWRYAPVTLALTLAIGAWWYVRNQLLYGDPTAMAVSLGALNGVIRPGQLSLDVATMTLPFAYHTLWARFGWYTVPAAPAIQLTFDWLLRVSLAGFAIWVIAAMVLAVKKHFSGTQIRQALVVSLFGAGWIIVLVWVASVAWFGNQGRFLLPGIAAWGALFAAGLDTWTPLRVKTLSSVVAVLGAGGVAAISLYGSYYPAFRPKPVDDAIAFPLLYRFEDNAELIGVSPSTVRARPGEMTTITLYWRALQPTEEPRQLRVYLHSIDTQVVRRDSYPATGNLLSTEWVSGQVWAETYSVIIPETAPQQLTDRLIAGLVEEDGDLLVATYEDGSPDLPIVGTIIIPGPPASSEPEYIFGDMIGLVESSLTTDGDQGTVCLAWSALSPLVEDFHVFVHVLSPDGTLLTQADYAPGQGRYPTSVWSVGEVVRDCVPVDLSDIPEDWSITIGLYQPVSGQVLSISNADGEILPDSRLVIAP